jgi:hypothetical protein
MTRHAHDEQPVGIEAERVEAMPVEAFMGAVAWCDPDGRAPVKPLPPADQRCCESAGYAGEGGGGIAITVDNLMHGGCGQPTTGKVTVDSDKSEGERSFSTFPVASAWDAAALKSRDVMAQGGKRGGIGGHGGQR